VCVSQRLLPAQKVIQKARLQKRFAPIPAGVHRYAIGDSVWSSSTRPETSANTKVRYGSDLQVFLLLNLLSILDAPEDKPITLVTSAPPAFVNELTK